MPYRIRKQESTKDAFRRVAVEQIGRAISEIDNTDLDRHETVHQVRKRCKKIRGLIRLFRPRFPAYKRENDFFRDAARPLSDVRDAQSIIETFDALISYFKVQVDPSAFASVREQLSDRRRRVADDEVGLTRELDQFRLAMQQARQRAAQWKVDGEGFHTVAGGLVKTHCRARRAMRRALKKPSTKNYHQWRKRTKYHWYHARLLRSIWKPIMNAHREAASKLSDVLGADHDLAILRSTVIDDSGAFGSPHDVNALSGLIDARRSELRKQAEPLGWRLFGEKSKHQARRFDAYWKAWLGPPEFRP